MACWSKISAVSRISTAVTTGSACAPIAAMVETSPAIPPAPLASLALKLSMQAGALASPASSSGASAPEGRSVDMARGRTTCESCPEIVIRFAHNVARGAGGRGYNPVDCSDPERPRRDRSDRIPNLDVPDLWLDLRRNRRRSGSWAASRHAVVGRPDELDVSGMRCAQGRFRDGSHLMEGEKMA